MWVNTFLLSKNITKSLYSSLIKLSKKNVSADASKLAGQHDLKEPELVSICGNSYFKDHYTNITPHIQSFISRDLHLLQNHPLNLIKRRIVSFMYNNYRNSRGNPLFSVFDNLPPVVTVKQNFDDLLVPEDHPSRKKSDTYYINSQFLLRPHTSAHQSELIRSGLDSFLVVGDVYRRDEIDSKHYPVFHQCEAVRLLSPHEIFKSLPSKDELKAFENNTKSPEKQGCHTLEATKMMEKDLKICLINLVRKLFGKDIKCKWVDTYFPFTHPSWELEIFHDGAWLEVLGCGIMEQEILNKAGASEKIGWAFGLGLERLAMKLYSIPDVRLFWSKDTGFLTQFEVTDIDASIKYKEVSKYPQCINDISFWVPADYQPNDFYDIARSIGGEMIEQVHKIDEFFHPKHKRQSYCYRIIYRHMEKTLLQTEVNEIHKQIEDAAVKTLNVEIR